MDAVRAVAVLQHGDAEGPGLGTHQPAAVRRVTPPAGAVAGRMEDDESARVAAHDAPLGRGVLRTAAMAGVARPLPSADSRIEANRLVTPVRSTEHGHRGPVGCRQAADAGVA